MYVYIYIYICSYCIIDHTYVYIYIYVYIVSSWRSVANDLKTHPHCEDAFVKKGLIGADTLAGADAFLKKHWKAQTHCEDTSDGRRRIAKIHWISEDALG